MTEETKHTPLPWHCGIFDGEPNVIQVWASEKTAVGSDRIDIAQIHVWKDATDESITNAEFICKAVNNHESLLEALKEVLAGARKAMSLSYYEQEPSVIKARAAIATAEDK